MGLHGDIQVCLNQSVSLVPFSREYALCDVLLCCKAEDDLLDDLAPNENGHRNELPCLGACTSDAIGRLSLLLLEYPDTSGVDHILFEACVLTFRGLTPFISWTRRSSGSIRQIYE